MKSANLFIHLAALLMRTLKILCCLTKNALFASANSPKETYVEGFPLHVPTLSISTASTNGLRTTPTVHCVNGLSTELCCGLMLIIGHCTTMMIRIPNNGNNRREGFLFMILPLNRSDRGDCNSGFCVV